MPAPTLIRQLDPAIRSRLTWRAMVGDGIEEAPLAVMRFEQYRRITSGFSQSEFHSRVLRSLAVAASKATQRLRNSEHLVAHYNRRSELRSVAESFGIDTPAGQAYLQQVEDMKPPTGIRRRASKVQEPTIVLTDDQLRERELADLRALAAGLPPSLTQFAASRGEPEFAPRERTREAVMQRREFASLQRRYRDAVRFVEREERAKSRRLAEAEAELSAVENPAPQAMRHADYVKLPAWERALHDSLLLVRQGRQVPVPSSHPLAHVPLHRRPGLT